MAWQTRPAFGRERRSIGRRILAGMTAAALVASLAVSPVAAGDSTITAPRIVYTGVNQTVDSPTDSDPIGEPVAPAQGPLLLLVLATMAMSGLLATTVRVGRKR